MFPYGAGNHIRHLNSSLFHLWLANLPSPYVFSICFSNRSSMFPSWFPGSPHVFLFTSPPYVFFSICFFHLSVFPPSVSRFCRNFHHVFHFFPGVPMVLLWFSYGFPMVFPPGRQRRAPLLRQMRQQQQLQVQRDQQNLWTWRWHPSGRDEQWFL